MSRPLRIQYPDAWYHVMNRGRRGETIFHTADDHRLFMDILHEGIELFSLRISSYCLMSNHYHLLVQTPAGNLSRCMRHINGVYTQRYNAAHGLDGPLFRGRYKAVLVDEDSYLLHLVRYIHRNPIRAGMVRRAEEYEYSSHQGYLSNAGKWNWLHKRFILSMISEEPGQQVQRYRAFMAEDEDESFLRIMNLKKLPSVLGDNLFIDRIKETFFMKKRHMEVPESKSLAPDGERIIDAVCGFYKTGRSELFHSRRGTMNEARNMAIYLFRQLRGDPLTDIGKAFDIESYSTVSSVIERFKIRMDSDRDLSRKVSTLRRRIMSQGQT